MKTKREQNQVDFSKGSVQRNSERGNALLYVLIAIALFAALSFTLGRQTDTGESRTLTDEQAELQASQLINYAVQAKSVIDQMFYSGTDIDEFDFTLPNEAGFNTAPNIHKVYHPEGGGLVAAALPDRVVSESTTDPAPGWYMGRFNNVEWTELGPGNTEGAGGAEAAYTDIILVAYQIAENVCAKINEKITGSATIPVMGDSIRETMIDDTFHTGTNVDLTTDPTGSPICSDCDNRSTLCVENQAQTAFGFYTVVADR